MLFYDYYAKTYFESSLVNVQQEARKRHQKVSQEKAIMDDGLECWIIFLEPNSWKLQALLWRKEMLRMKFNFDINKLITIGGIGLSAVGALLSSIANDKKMESAVEKKVEEALNARKEEET